MTKLTTTPAHNSQLTGYSHLEPSMSTAFRNYEELRLDTQESTLKHCVFDNPEVVKNIKGVIQIGAAYGEQVEKFNEMKIPIQIYFEPVTKAYNITKEKLKKYENKATFIHIFNVAIGDKFGISKFYECGPNNSNSSSLLQFSKVATQYNPKLVTDQEYDVPVWTLDAFVADKLDNFARKCNLLFMDTQGYEGFVIQGAKNIIQQFDYVYTEVNHIPLYEGTMLFREFNELMNSLGFILADLTPLIKSTGSQSNALYKKAPTIASIGPIKDLSDTIHFKDAWKDDENN